MMQNYAKLQKIFENSEAHHSYENWYTPVYPKLNLERFLRLMKNCHILLINAYSNTNHM